MAWQPKKVNEIIIIPPLKICPGCGHTKLYYSHETKSSVVQTDLKFTPSGIRQHVTEYRSGTAKCAKCAKRTMNKTLRIMHYGDNLFALVINYYVNYHISNENHPIGNDAFCKPLHKVWGAVTPVVCLMT